MLSLAIDNHVSQVLIPHIESPKGALWVMKASGSGSNMLMGLATKSDEMRQLLKEKADAHLELINKRISPDDFDRINDDVNKRIMEFSEYVKPEDIARVRAAHRARLDETETTLIAYAKLRST